MHTIENNPALDWSHAGVSGCLSPANRGAEDDDGSLCNRDTAALRRCCRGSRVFTELASNLSFSLNIDPQSINKIIKQQHTPPSLIQEPIAGTIPFVPEVLVQFDVCSLVMRNCFLKFGSR